MISTLVVVVHAGSVYVYFFFFKQKTAYEMRISDWSSDVCSSDLAAFPCLHSGTAFVRQGQSPESEDPFRETCGIVPDILVIIILYRDFGVRRANAQILAQTMPLIKCLRARAVGNAVLALYRLELMEHPHHLTHRGDTGNRVAVDLYELRIREILVQHVHK